jgi:hypothetical protein
MKNYIGVKIVKAEPKEKNGVPGYAVKYPDGYVSWLSLIHISEPTRPY